MWEFLKNIFAIYIAIGIFILNFIASAGILKFYFDKKLAAQKEEADKKITELNGKIERGNYVHKIQFEKEFLIYEEILEHLSNLIEHIYSLVNCIRYIKNDVKIVNQELINKMDSFLNSAADFTKFYEKFLYLYSDELYLEFQLIDKQSTILIKNVTKLVYDMTKKEFQFNHINEYFDEHSLNIHKEMENTRKDIIYLIKERLENLKIVA